MSAFISHIRSEKGIHPTSGYFLDIGMDGGSSTTTLKFEINLQKLEDESSSPAAKSKKKWSYQGAISSKNFLESDIHRMLNVALV